MKKKFIWAKTLITIYRYLVPIAGAIDKIVLSKGLHCGRFNMYDANDAYDSMQKIIDFSERKITMINLKILTESILLKIKREDARILISKYIDGVKFKDLAEKYEISLRTTFRRIDRGLQDFERLLTARGYDDEKIRTIVKDEKWILSVYKEFEKEAEEISIYHFLPKEMKPKGAK